MTSCPSPQAIAAYLDGEMGANADAVERRRIERHLEECPHCMAEAESIRSVDRAARALAAPVTAPPSLIGWIDVRRRRLSTSRDRAFSLRRREALAWMAGAAAIGAIVALRPDTAARRSMAPTLFHDYSTRLAADRALDLRAADLDVALSWFETRLPFEPPRLSPIDQVGLRGARLCWLLDRRIAAFHLGAGGEAGCLYVAEAADLTLDGAAPLPLAAPAVLSDGARAGAFWRAEDLAYGLVGVGSLATIAALADQLHAVS